MPKLQRLNVRFNTSKLGGTAEANACTPPTPTGHPVSTSINRFALSSISASASILAPVSVTLQPRKQRAKRASDLGNADASMAIPSSPMFRPPKSKRRSSNFRGNACDSTFTSPNVSGQPTRRNRKTRSWSDITCINASGNRNPGLREGLSKRRSKSNSVKLLGSARQRAAAPASPHSSIKASLSNFEGNFVARTSSPSSCGEETPSQLKWRAWNSNLSSRSVSGSAAATALISRALHWLRSKRRRTRPLGMAVENSASVMSPDNMPLPRKSAANAMMEGGKANASALANTDAALEPLCLLRAARVGSRGAATCMETSCSSCSSWRKLVSMLSTSSPAALGR
mmetsp:Transcript_70915/g.178794  ORF Transcript_70915/g.178794 Transcript_70915/m.178794 type:complete len:342 (+) Transcript_70915:492-1517(+)